jgi:hypothetical protein
MGRLKHRRICERGHAAYRIEPREDALSAYNRSGVALHTLVLIYLEDSSYTRSYDFYATVT